MGNKQQAKQREYEKNIGRIIQQAGLFRDNEYEIGQIVNVCKRIKGPKEDLCYQVALLKSKEDTVNLSAYQSDIVNVKAVRPESFV